MPSFSFLSLPFFLEEAQALFWDAGVWVGGGSGSREIAIFDVFLRASGWDLFFALNSTRCRFLPGFGCFHAVLFILWPWGHPGVVIFGPGAPRIHARALQCLKGCMEFWQAVGAGEFAWFCSTEWGQHVKKVSDPPVPLIPSQKKHFRWCSR